MKEITKAWKNVKREYFHCGYCSVHHKSQATAARCPARAHAQRMENRAARRLVEKDWVHRQDHVGHLFGDRETLSENGRQRRVWHTDCEGNFWSGSWHTRTREQLYAEAKTIIEDLEELYPGIGDEDT